jgi:hypothetical protein
VSMNFFDWIMCCSLAGTFHLAVARQIHHACSGKTKICRGWQCHAMVDRADFEHSQ